MAKAIVALKICNKCRAPKPVTEYHKKADSPDGLCHSCRACRAINKKQYYESNKSDILARGKEYRATRPDLERERHKRWLEKNPGKNTEYCNRWHEKNPAYRQEYREKNKDRFASYYKEWLQNNRIKSRAYTAKWATANPLKIIAYREANRENQAAFIAEWRSKNPEARTVWNHTRRARKVAAGGRHTADDLKQIMERQEYRCANPHCGADLMTIKKELDHKQPLALGGSNDPENLQWLCTSCNRRKHAKAMDEWLKIEALRHSKAA